MRYLRAGEEKAGDHARDTLGRGLSGAKDFFESEEVAARSDTAEWDSSRHDFEIVGEDVGHIRWKPEGLASPFPRRPGGERLDCGASIRERRSNGQLLGLEGKELD